MPIDDRVAYLLLGMAIGFVLGYFTRLVREIKEELDEVKDEIEHDVIPRIKNEGGFMRYPWIANIAVLLTVGLTAYAALVSQKASNDSQDSQDRIEVVAYCNFKVTSEALTALNERSGANKQSAQANVDLQTDFAKFFNLLLHQPPLSSETQLDAAKTYQKSLNNFVNKSTHTKNKIQNNPFPTDQDLRTCIAAGKTEGVAK